MAEVESMDCECHEHKAWYHERTELDPGNAKVEFKKDQQLNSIRKHGSIMPWAKCLGSRMHRAESKQDKNGFTRDKSWPHTRQRLRSVQKAWVGSAMETVPLIMKRPRLNLGRTNWNQALARLSWQRAQAFFKHEKAIACALGTSQNHNPRRPTTVFSGLQRGTKWRAFTASVLEANKRHAHF